MEIILLETIKKLGKFGNLVTVKAGYGRNHLIPKKMAVHATKANIAKFAAERAELEAKQNETLSAAIARAENISALGKVTIEAKSGDEGKLFGSVGTNGIVDALQAAGVQTDKKEIRLPNGLLRTLGQHEVDVQLHSEVTAQLIVEIVATA